MGLGCEPTLFPLTPRCSPSSPGAAGHFPPDWQLDLGGGKVRARENPCARSVGMLGSGPVSPAHGTPVLPHSSQRISPKNPNHNQCRRTGLLGTPRNLFLTCLKGSMPKRGFPSTGESKSWFSTSPPWVRPFTGFVPSALGCFSRRTRLSRQAHLLL